MAGKNQGGRRRGDPASASSPPRVRQIRPEPSQVSDAGPGSPAGAAALFAEQAAEHARRHQGERRPPLREGTTHPPQPPGMPEPQPSPEWLRHRAADLAGKQSGVPLAE